MNMRNLKPVPDPELSGVLDGDAWPLIEDGIYEITFVKRLLSCPFGPAAPKLTMWFRVITFGEAFGKVIPCYYNIKSMNAKKGTFTIGRCSKFMREYARLFGVPEGTKRIGTGPFKDITIRAKITTVKTDRDGKPLAHDLWYSRVCELIEEVKP